MTHLVVNTIPNTVRSTRRWMVIAFIAGLVFTAVLAQTLAAVNKDLPGSNYKPTSSEGQDSLTPSPMPDDNYLIDKNLYGLVYACPGRGAFFPG